MKTFTITIQNSTNFEIFFNKMKQNKTFLKKNKYLKVLAS